MKLIIDRFSNNSNIYSFEFGPDFDISIGFWRIERQDDETMAEIDKIITKSVELKFCVLYIKHPFLLEQCEQPGYSSSNLWKGITEITFRKKLRDYFALRLLHRRHPVELYEFGRRLFV